MSKTNSVSLVFTTKNKIVTNELLRDDSSSKKLQTAVNSSVDNIKTIGRSTTKALNYNSLLGAVAPFTKVFVIRGIGYQADIIEDAYNAPEFSFIRYLSLRVGHSFLIYKPIPNYINVKVHKKDRKLVIYGADKDQVANFSQTIYKLRPPSVYTGRGIRIKKGLHRRKLGKKDIRKGKV